MADPHLIELLHRGSAAWNDWRTEHSNPTAAQQFGFPKLDLRGLDLPNFDFRGYRLEHVDLTGSKLPGANLTAVLVGLSNLDEVDLTGAILDGVVLSRSTLCKSVLRGARCAELADGVLDYDGGTMKGAHMSTVDFSGADLTGASISHASMFGNNFSDANLTDAVFKDCDVNSSSFVRTNLTNTVLAVNLSECRFHGALLHNTRLSQYLYRVDFQGADLSNLHPDNNFSSIHFSDANFQKANLSGCIFDGAQLGGIFDGAILQGASFKGVHVTPQAYGLAKAKWAGADFTGAQFDEGINLSNTDFSEAILASARLSKVLLNNSNFTSADLTDCQFTGAQLDCAILKDVRGVGANFTGANLHDADLSDSNFSESQLRDTNLNGAKFYRTKLEYAMLVRANVEGAHFVQASIFGLSNWGMKGTPAYQQDLVITQSGENEITVGDIQFAQLLYTLLDRQNFTPVIDLLTSKAVLLLGSFAPERKAVLDSLATELSHQGLLPILFDFTGPRSRNIEETVRILAGLSKFVIADVTIPISSPQELHATAPDIQLPIFPILEEGHIPYSMLEDLKRGRYWVSFPQFYASNAAAVELVGELIIQADELIKRIQEDGISEHQAFSKIRATQRAIAQQKLDEAGKSDNSTPI